MKYSAKHGTGAAEGTNGLTGTDADGAQLKRR